ncbi:MAG: triosephosphate isomerase [Solobacterium sp.]|nr:triosephosphate isomerase [Solobacterium sp.]
MKHIYLNLKRFDVPPQYGGVNRIAPVSGYGQFIVKAVQDALKQYEGVEFAVYFPEAHLLSALAAKTEGSPFHIGAQSVYRDDTAVGGNFGAFTSNRTASAVAAIGCDTVMIGHCEERNDLLGVMAEAGLSGSEAKAAVNRILNKEIKCALNRGLYVLYCIGERSEEQDEWQEVLGAQINDGLEGVSTENIVIAYEPVWSIGPGKTPADKPYIQKIARFIKSLKDVDVVYGGGLKQDNAPMLASIPEISGGLIALTRFSGDIGFYPEEYLEIIDLYLSNCEQ